MILKKVILILFCSLAIAACDEQKKSDPDPKDQNQTAQPDLDMEKVKESRERMLN